LASEATGDSIGNSLRMSLKRVIKYIDIDEYVDATARKRPAAAA
jgi:hypothetical protein